MKLVVPALAYEDVLFYDALRTGAVREGIDLEVFTTSPALARFASEEGVAIRFVPASPAPKDADAVYARYGIEDPREFVFGEWAYYRHESLVDLVATGASLFASIEDYLAESKPDAILQYLGAERVRRVLHRVGDRRGIPNVWAGWTPLPDQVVFHADERYSWEQLRIPDPAALDDAARERASTYLEAFRSRRARATYAPVAPAIPRAGFFGGLRAKWREYRLSGWGPGHAARVLSRTTRDNLSERIRRIDLRRRVYPNATRSRQLLEEKPYAFFPISWWRESRTTIGAPFAADPADFVVPLARALPEGMRLLVKDHPYHVGALSRSTVARISREPNVRWVAPDLSAHTLMDGAALVVVTNSTVGYEAILRGCRVLVAGHEFYRGLGLTVDSNGTTDLEARVREALAIQPDQERILAFVHAVHRCSRPGSWNARTPENIQVLARSLRSYLEERFAAEEERAKRMSSGVAPST